MALAQFLHESGGLQDKVEIQCITSGCPGQYATPGCDADGKHYFGRGYIQLSWCPNYKSASQDLYQDARLVSDPDSVASNESYAWDTAFWFWKVILFLLYSNTMIISTGNYVLVCQANVHGKPGVSDNQFGATTKAINGALECDVASGQSIAKERFTLYGKVRGGFGLSGPGNPAGCY